MEAGEKNYHPTEDDVKKKATPEQLVDWRIGHHVEAAGKMIADALHRIADQMERDHQLHAAEVDLRREQVLSVLESKAMADRAAQKLMGLMPDLPSSGGDSILGPEWPPQLKPFDRMGPEWVKNVLADADA